MKEKKDRVDDALHATRAAVEEVLLQVVVLRWYVQLKYLTVLLVQMMTKL